VVLVVDDDEVIRDVIGEQLVLLGYEVLTAADGEEALRIFQEQSAGIALVLLDYAMPRMDGLTLLSHLRRIKPGIPVILASGFIGELDCRGASEKPTSFLTKPFRFEKLREQVKRLIGESVEAGVARPAA